MTWPTPEEGRVAVSRWAVEQGESFAVPRAEAGRWLAVRRKAKEESCDFRIRISTKDGKGVITVLNPVHTCPPKTHAKWRIPNSVRFLTTNNFAHKLVADDHNVRPKQLQTNERMGRGNQVKYMPVYRLREHI